MDIYLTKHEKRLSESKYFTEMNEIKSYRESNKEKLSLKIIDRRLDYKENKKETLNLLILAEKYLERMFLKTMRNI